LLRAAILGHGAWLVAASEKNLERLPAAENQLARSYGAESIRSS